MFCPEFWFFRVINLSSNKKTDTPVMEVSHIQDSDNSEFQYGPDPWKPLHHLEAVKAFNLSTHKITGEKLIASLRWKINCQSLTGHPDLGNTGHLWKPSQSCRIQITEAHLINYMKISASNPLSRHQGWKFPTRNCILVLCKSVCYIVADSLFHYFHKFHGKLETVEIPKHKRARWTFSHLFLRSAPQE